MDAAIATKVLEAAREGRFMDEDIPEDEAQLLKLGQWWLDEAVKAQKNGMADNETVLQILAAAGVSTEVPKPEPEEEEVVSPDQEEVEEAAEDPVEPETPSQESTQTTPVADPEGNHGSREQLPVPPEVQGDVLPVPRDLTTLTDRDLRRLMGEYNALFARVIWLAAVEGSDLANSEHMMEHCLRVSRRKVRADGNKRTQEELNDDAREDEEFQTWEGRHLEHDNQFRELRARKDIYGGHLERLSREASIRDQEFQRTS